MDTARFERTSDNEWHIAPHGDMRVPGIIYASEALIRGMDEKVYEQVVNVATLPGIVKASYAMPDAHWGYGFPIGGVAAFDAEAGGVVSAGGVGFDISCGVRTLTTGLRREQIESRKRELADTLFAVIPAGVGSTGRLHLNAQEMHAMLSGGARWAVQQGFGTPQDLERIEEHGRMAFQSQAGLMDLPLPRLPGRHQIANAAAALAAVSAAGFDISRTSETPRPRWFRLAARSRQVSITDP